MENSIVVTTVYRYVTAQNHLERLMKIPVPVLAKELETYKTSHHILTYLAVPIAVWGCFGNFFSFRIMMLPHNRKSAACVYLAALACTDSVHLLFTVHKWILGRMIYRSDWMCKLVFWYGLTGKCSSVAFIIIVTLQRCVAIVLPLKRMEWMIAQAAKTKVIPLVVICALAYTSYKCLVVTKADPGILACDAVSGTSVTARIAGMITLFFDGILPFVIISIMNTLIIRAIRQRHREFDAFNAENPGGQSGNTESGDKSVQENRQLTLTLILVCTSFLLLATPLYFLLATYSFVDNKASPDIFATFQLIKTIFEQMLHINAGINFWLYCAAGKRFRTDVKAILCCSLSRGRSLASSDTVSASTINVKM